MVMLHPFPFDGRAWTDNVQAIIDAGHRVITLDYPGFGDSPPAPAPLSIPELAAVVADLLDTLRIDAAALVGLSMGGYVALAFSRQFPERLWALVLADTLAAADSAAARQGRVDALRAIQERGVDGYLQQSIARLLSPGAAPELLARVMALAERREETLNTGIAALRDRPDGTAQLGQLPCPTLALVGAADQVSPPAEMRTMAGEIPEARFVEISGAGHLSNLEAPLAFNAAVTEFLRGAATAAIVLAVRGSHAVRGS